MKLASLKDNSTVIVTENGNIRLTDLGYDVTVMDIIKNPILFQSISEEAVNTPPHENTDYSNFKAPISDPQKIIAIGLNYADHAGESKMEIPKFPIIFTKFPNSITGPSDDIIIPASLTQRVDYEVELGVVIGSRAKNVSEADALEYIFGYTVINDVSARDLQFADGQWVRGKSLDTFCPMGPVIVTKDEISDVQNLNLYCEVNGSKLQNDNTSNMIFGVAKLISLISQSFTLEPGDIIATGTPSGVGFSRKPPIYLKNGDTVKTYVQNIGELNNKVIEI